MNSNSEMNGIDRAVTNVASNYGENGQASGQNESTQEDSDMSKYLCLPICAFGVVTNVVHILVLTSKNMRTSPVNIILSAIAICDAGTMLSYLIYLVHFVLSPKDYCARGGAFLSWPWMLFLMIHISFSIALHTCSLWLVVAMAFVRLMTLRQGTLSSKWHKSEMAWKISILTMVMILILCVPTIASHEIREFHRGAWHSMCRTNLSPAQYMNDSSYGVYTIGISELAQRDDCGLYKANLWLTGIMFKVIPSCLLILLSISLLTRISAAVKNRRRLLNGDASKKAVKSLIANYNGVPSGHQCVHLTTAAAAATKPQQDHCPRYQQCRRSPWVNLTLFKRGDKKHPRGSRRSRSHKSSSTDHTTIMLITILFVFLLTEFPQGVIAILNAVFLHDVTAYVYQSLDDFMDLLSLVNACVNFILYCVMSSRYRQAFWLSVLPRQAYIRLFLRKSTAGKGQQGGRVCASNVDNNNQRRVLLGNPAAAPGGGGGRRRPSLSFLENDVLRIGSTIYSNNCNEQQNCSVVNSSIGADNGSPLATITTNQFAATLFPYDSSTIHSCVKKHGLAAAQTP